MEIPKSQQKLIIKQLPNMGRKPKAYEVRHHDGRYLADIYFIEINNQWCISGNGLAYLTAYEVEQLNDFMKKLPVSKSIY